jgi:hypothetical protein
VQAYSLLLMMKKNHCIMEAVFDEEARADGLRPKPLPVLRRALDKNDHFILSTKFTEKRETNQSGEFVEKILGSDRTYNPNRFNKSGNPRCGKYDGSCMGNCTRYGIMDVPSNDDCWTASYRWHLEPHSTRARRRGGKRPIMVRILEDGVLGDGQKIEKALAEELKIEVVEIEWSGFIVTGGGEEFKESHRLLLRRKLERKLGQL